MAYKLTPMMQQYKKIKDKYSDCIILYRLGDFYEMFFDDAIVASKLLEIVLTGKNCGLEERAPMCGVPHHAVDSYIPKLIEAGYKVAICEQIEDPKIAKGIVKRDVVRIVTPGTVMEQTMLEDKTNNYLACLYINHNSFGLSYVDISTGELNLTCYTGYNRIDTSSAIEAELEKIRASEVICNIKTNTYLDKSMNVFEDNLSDKDRLLEKLKKQFKIESISELNIKDNSGNALLSLAMLIDYLELTQKRSLDHINRVTMYGIGDYVEMDISSRRNLELVETIRGKKGKGTLYDILDYTHTAMGGRLLKNWIEQPLRNLVEINRRLDSVQSFYENTAISNDIVAILKRIYDIERIISKIAYGTCNAKDLVSLKQSIEGLPELKSSLTFFESELLKEIYTNFDVLEDIHKFLEISIVDNPPISVKEGGIIKSGFNKELDEILDVSVNAKQWVSNLQAVERKRTGIKNLKIGYNRIFGYYIDITKSNLDNVPDNYIRKQTLSNSERFITPDLKEMESKILNANEQLVKLEYEIFCSIRKKINENIKRVQSTARKVAVIDVLNSLATAAQNNNYIRPIMNEGSSIEIKKGRHPVIEKLMSDDTFVPNDTKVNTDDIRMSIITGPNMAGKSTYMRQIALITLMAHIGSFVPAEEANICIVDKIFTRVGASDDLAQGKSTFMVEMSEVSNIIRNATEKSLVILDEIGRGTSTYDGLSIAWAVVEYITNSIRCKTLFATHYHELSVLENKIDGIKNYRILVNESNDKITFLRTIAEGSIDKSYGIQVAKLAGIPEEVISRAKDILMSIDDENGYVSMNKINGNDDFSDSELMEDEKLNEQLSFLPDKEDISERDKANLYDDKEFKKYKSFISNYIDGIDVNTMTPIEAMVALSDIKRKANKLKK